jgi:hypothetical protein
MFNKSQLSKDHKDAKKPRSLAKPKDIDYVSKMGYRDDSPFNDRPYIDIKTPNGVIDMSNTGIDLIANGRFLPKYSGLHQLGDTEVREIPAAQMGGEQYVDLTDEEIEEYRRGGYIVEELPKAQAAETTPEEKVTEQELDVRRPGGYVSKQMVHFLTGGAYEENSLPQAQKGSQVYTYADRPEATYKKDSKGNWLISLPSTDGKYVPIKDPSGKRAGELNEKAQPVMDPTKAYKTVANASVQNKINDLSKEEQEQALANYKNGLFKTPYEAQQDYLIAKKEQQQSSQRNQPVWNEAAGKYVSPAEAGAWNNYKDGALQSTDWLWTLPIALPAVTQAVGAVGAMSLPGMSSIPGATVGNLVNSGFIANSLLSAPENAKDWYDVSQGKKDWTDAAIGSAEIAAGLFGSGSGFKSLVQDATAVKNAVANPGALLPKYKNVYRVEPTTFQADPNSPLTGNWFGELGEMPFYAKNLKDPNAGVRIMRQKMPVKQWEAMSGHNLPAQAKTMSAGPGDYKTFADAAKNGEISMGAAKRLQAGMQTSRDLEELAANPRLINLSEGVLPEQLVNKIRNTKGSKWYSNKETVEYPASEQGRQGAQDHLWQLLGQQYKNQGYEKPILGIPRTYFPFEEGGSAGKPANRWAVTDPRSMQVDNYFPKLQDGGNTDPGNNALELHMFYDKDVYKQDGGEIQYLTDQEIEALRKQGYQVDIE